MTKKVPPKTCRGVCVKRLTIVQQTPYNAFTLIELILVVGIIMVLADLVLTTVGYARKKGARARAETEIAAMSAACENYKADNGVYPRDNSTPGSHRRVGRAAERRSDTKHLYERQFIFVHAAQRIERKIRRRLPAQEVIFRSNRICSQ